jgi:phosphotransferase system enzyme I (PtsI)
MIMDVDDVRRSRKIIGAESALLESENIETGRVRIGAMIEVPSAVQLARTIAAEVDFFSLGTNDLVQYMLAVDRSNDDVADWFQTLHPSVLQSIYQVLTAANAAGIPSIICGEMAGTPAYAVMLLGLGATELSMTSSSIPRVRQVISRISHRDAHDIAMKCLQCGTASEVEQIVRDEYLARWPQLFSTKSLPVIRHKT